ncbi:MAG: T9SS C-terminal target domain-containing protein, partial [Bacteroidetes bacterium]
AQQGRLLFFDAMGRQVREERITFAGRQYEADVSALPSGLYLVVVRTDAGTAAGRVVVLR